MLTKLLLLLRCQVVVRAVPRGQSLTAISNSTRAKESLLVQWKP